VEPHAPDEPRTLGVVGTLVWDTIHRRDGRAQAVEEWGGIGYALEALSAALPEDWEVLPILKVGRDLSERAFRFLRELPRVRPEPGVKVVPEPNNRVEIRYLDDKRRAERLTGGVPPWTGPELTPLTGLCDALYVNFISGFEMELETAQSLRVSFRGPIYADLHSLFLGVGRLGDRFPRPLPHWSEWLRCFDAVQMNEDECALLGRTLRDVGGDGARLQRLPDAPGLRPDEVFTLGAVAADVLGPELKLITVTLGERGSAYVAGPGFSPDPCSWGEGRGRMAAPGPMRSGKVEAEAPTAGGDPTGSGDVWGATFFSRLLAGDPLETAMAGANRAGSRNVEHRGARGLGLHLARRVAPGGEP
jgi:hypothetical protein